MADIESLLPGTWSVRIKGQKTGGVYTFNGSEYVFKVDLSEGGLGEYLTGETVSGTWVVKYAKDGLFHKKATIYLTSTWIKPNLQNLAARFLHQGVGWIANFVMSVTEDRNRALVVKSASKGQITFETSNHEIWVSRPPLLP